MFKPISAQSESTDVELHSYIKVPIVRSSVLKVLARKVEQLSSQSILAHKLYPTEET
jgi:hypothetical protein